MSGSQNIFSVQANTTAINATASASAPMQLPFAGGAVRIVNEGPNTAFIAVAATATNATVPGSAPGAQTCTPVLAGSDVTLSMATGQLNWISAICRAAGTAVLSISTGQGM